MPDYLFVVTITQPDDTETTMTVDVTNVANRTQAINAARTFIQDYRAKYVQGGSVEKALSIQERTR